MQKEINRNMTTKQAFIHAAERAGIKVQYYLDTNNECYLTEAMSYIRAAHSLLKEMSDEIE